jgi:PIN domain nuclease of toxin-antitoxin system
MERSRLWQNGVVPDSPDTWLEQALRFWSILPITVAIARQSILWPRAHRDPVDRSLAATGHVERVELWHTNTTLRKLTGFPQRYFVNVVERR